MDNKLISYITTAAVLILCGGGGCATSIPLKTIKALHLAAVTASAQVEKSCDKTLSTCIANKKNPCEALDKCIMHRISPGLIAVAAVQRALKLATYAVQMEDNIRYEDALIVAQEALMDVQFALSDWLQDDGPKTKKRGEK